MSGQLLNVEERKLLEQFKNSSSGIQQRRCHLILLYDDGLLTHQAAEQAGFSRSQARFWKHQFLMDGLAIFPELSSKKSPGTTLENASFSVEEESSQESESHPENNSTAELPFPVLIKRPGISASDSLAEAGRKTWLYLFSIMLEKEAPTRSGEDIEDLHDMRVATRRMRSAFDIFGKAYKPKKTKKYLTGLRSAGRALGRVRDMDVLINKLDQYIMTLDDTRREGLDPLVNAWHLERANGRQALITHFDSSEYIQFKNEFNQFVQTPGEGVVVTSTTTPKPNLVCEIVPVLIYKSMGTIRAYNSILDNANDSQLHALRIEFKKFRYAVEYFREVLGEEATQVIGDIKLVQDLLGNFQDAVVACGLVTNFLKDWQRMQLTKPLVERQSPEQIVNYLAYLHAERHQQLVKLPAVWDHLNRSEFRINLAKAIAAL